MNDLLSDARYALRTLRKDLGLTLVIVVSLAIECLVAVFQLSHKDPTQLPAAATIGVAAGVILVAWGVFLRLNRSVEELEPEAMQEAKDEDHKVG
jgi:hypothetical protein